MAYLGLEPRTLSHSAVLKTIKLLNPSSLDRVIILQTWTHSSSFWDLDLNSVMRLTLMITLILKDYYKNQIKSSEKGNLAHKSCSREVLLFTQIVFGRHQEESG